MGGVFLLLPQRSKHPREMVITPKASTSICVVFFAGVPGIATSQNGGSGEGNRRNRRAADASHRGAGTASLKLRLNPSDGNHQRFTHGIRKKSEQAMDESKLKPSCIMSHSTKVISTV